VPATDTEVLKTPLLGLFEKKRAGGFYKYLDKVDIADSKTWGKHALDKLTMKELFKAFSLSDDCVDFLGHALAMYVDDSYLDQPAIQACAKIGLYMDSIGKYGDSPFLYPVYGLGGLPESFSRLCAIHGGTYMLNAKVDGIEF